MNERCPLPLGANESVGDLPDICRDVCEPRWDEARMTTAPIIDMFDKDRCMPGKQCTHDVESDGDYIQVGKGGEREYIVLNICAKNLTELSNDRYGFICPIAE